MSRVERIGDATVTFAGGTATATIYCLKGTQEEVPVYVGSTSQKLRLRIRAHMLDAKKGSPLPVHVWLRSRSAFCVEVLEVVAEADREARERHWIKQFAGLLNLTDGGPGMSGHRFAGSEHARRIADRIRTSRTYTCETCAGQFHRKRSQAAKGNCRFCSRECYQRWQVGRPKIARAA